MTTGKGTSGLYQSVRTLFRPSGYVRVDVTFTAGHVLPATVIWSGSSLICGIAMLESRRGGASFAPLRGKSLAGAGDPASPRQGSRSSPLRVSFDLRTNGRGSAGTLFSIQIPSLSSSTTESFT